MMNEFRSHPKICGWLYTEHHDVINEWNGYFKYDRTEKYTGLDNLVPGMTINDLHSDIYIAPAGPLCTGVKPLETIQVPLFASFMTDADHGNKLIIRTSLYGWDQSGNYKHYSNSSQSIAYQPWSAKEVASLSVKMPATQGLAILSVVTEDVTGRVLHRNFTTFYISEGPSKRNETTDSEGQQLNIVRFSPAGFKSQKWSQKQWNVLDGLKANGAGSGYFEYEIKIPDGVTGENTEAVLIVAELSAKQLFGKDRQDATLPEGDYMLGKGTNDPGRNPNSYPMTDTEKYPSVVRIMVEGKSAGTFVLEDDPADHRGILSWFSQPQNRSLNEAGSYGYLIRASVPIELIRKATDKKLTIRFEVDESMPGGLAVYGERFGRYPVDPSVIFVMKQ
jgi:hypothetical protein